MILSSAFIAVYVHFTHKSRSIEAVANLTTLPCISLGVEYFESKNRVYADSRDKLFATMQPINMMDFVYAK